MIAWLSDWLRDIIAVILLAVLVELLLPNKAMQRYARLVVGLFILLTLLSPVLRLFQEDIGPRLDASIRMWNERSAERNVKMPTLEEIERKAAELAEQRNAETARLLEQTLANGMLAELRKTQGRSVEHVDVTLVWGDKRAKSQSSDIPDIGGITVTLKARQPGQTDAANGGLSPPSEKVENVQPVSIHVRVEEMAEPGAGVGRPDAQEGFASVEDNLATAIRDVIYQGWGVHRDRILIRERLE